MINNNKILLLAIIIIAISGFYLYEYRPVTPIFKTDKENPIMASNKAVYSFKLVSSDTNLGINDITGNMKLTQFDSCGSWETNYNFETQYYYNRGINVFNKSEYVSLEAKDGSSFNFGSKVYSNGKKIEELRGFIANDSKSAIYTKPKDLKYKLSKGNLLPIAHTKEIIRRAKAGEHFFSSTVFDGTDDKGPMKISVFIGKKLNIDDIKKIRNINGKINKELITDTAWNVYMAIFPVIDRDNMLPAYEIKAVLHDNGIISYAVIDYGSFKLEQKLLSVKKVVDIKCD